MQTLNFSPKGTQSSQPRLRTDEGPAKGVIKRFGRALRLGSGKTSPN